MNPFLGSIFWLLITLGVLVTFHEFGHYWVARRCGVKVLRFSVGFGRALWSRIGRDGTEYRIAAIPLGGYVKMLDAREGEVDPALYGQEFTRKPIGQRIAIVAAGPGFNLIFTLAAFWLMFMLGRADIAPLITAAPNSIAAQAGVRSGDRIITVDGKPVHAMGDALEAIANGLLGRDPLPLTVRDASGAQRQLVLPLDRLPPGQDIGQYMDALGVKAASPPAIAATVTPNLPAALGGMRAGDKLMSVNGQSISGDFGDFSKLIADAAAKSPRLSIGIARNGTPLTLQITARLGSIQGEAPHWMIGIGAPPLEPALERYGPLGALRESLALTRERIASTFNMLGKMLNGKASTKNLTGVVGIAEVANASANQGLSSFIEFLGTVSLSLAILNLLPIPVLDGGHLLYYLIELVKGRPVSERTMIIGQYVGLVVLFAVMGLAFFNDIQRHIPPS